VPVGVCPRRVELGLPPRPMDLVPVEDEGGGEGRGRRPVREGERGGARRSVREGGEPSARHTEEGGRSGGRGEG
jgi:hypothetical protein